MSLEGVGDADESEGATENENDEEEDEEDEEAAEDERETGGLPMAASWRQVESKRDFYWWLPLHKKRVSSWVSSFQAIPDTFCFTMFHARINSA